MAKGAVLIGCGFKPTQADVENAIEAGYIKNCDAVSTTSFDLEVDEKLAYATYISMSRERGWEDPGGLQAMRLTTRDGRQMWSVYPTGGAHTQSPHQRTTSKKWWQFWK
jgi:hypothetical protein